MYTEVQDNQPPMHTIFVFAKYSILCLQSILFCVQFLDQVGLQHIATTDRKGI